MSLEKVKKRKLGAMKIHDAANAIFEKKGSKNRRLHFSSLTVVELDTLLRWYNLSVGKMTRQEKVLKLEESCNLNCVPAPIEGWTADDEGKLQSLKNAEIELADTAVGRKRELMLQQFRAGGVDLPDDEFDQIIELRKRKREETRAD